jgi:hypothetical protein
MAFDYLVRFVVRRINPAAIEFTWVAEYSILNPFSPILKDVISNGETGEIAEYADTETSRLARRIIDTAKKNLNRYLASGELSSELMHSAICLAQLDPISRVRYVDPNLGQVQQEDIEELKELISIVKADDFRATKIALLNPTFGEGSHLVGGADADLVIDDQLIDIKTTQKLELQLHAFHQLMGYVVLSHIGLLGAKRPRVEIDKAGIYFSRFGYLLSFRIADVTDLKTLPSFIAWFKARAAKAKSDSMAKRNVK